VFIVLYGFIVCITARVIGSRQLYGYFDHAAYDNINIIIIIIIIVILIVIIIVIIVVN